MDFYVKYLLTFFSFGIILQKIYFEGSMWYEAKQRTDSAASNG